ncbi:MAG: hypothetical protein HFH01_07035 [Dorea sp.]|nr:hypothetical protein [Dorea sp.]
MKNIKTKILIIVIVCMMVIAITPAFLFGELKADSLTMMVGDNAEIALTNPVLQMVAKYETVDGNLIAAGQGGRIEAYEPGETEVEVKVPFRTLTCKVYVLGFEESELTMLTGQTQELGIGGASEDAEFYSSDREVVDVVDGDLVALKDGVADIVCNDNGRQVSQSIYVAGITSERPYLFAGNKMQLNTNESLIGKAKGWMSSDPLVATVDETGAVTGVASGTAEISCQTADDQSLSTTVNVVAMKEPEIYLQSGDIYSDPLAGGVSFDTEGIEWRSANKDVVRVDESGNIRAVNGGEAEITCSVEGQKLTGKVYVMSLPERAYTAVGMSSKLQLSNAGNSSVLWKSSDESKVKVTGGVLQGVGAGTARITATANNKSLSCDVSVVQLSNSSLTMKEESKTKTIKVAGAEGQEVKWASADSTIAQVSQTGEITPISEGKTMVFCNIGPSTMSIPVTIEEKDLQNQQAQEVSAQTAGQAQELSDTQGDTGAAADTAARVQTGAAPQTASKEEASDKSSKTETSESKEDSSDSKSEEKTDTKEKTETSKTETAEKVENTGGQLTGPEAIVACGNYYNSVLEEAVENGEKWVYSNSSKYVAQSGSFEKMLAGKIRGGNCASIANWAYRDMGIISSSEKFYGDGNGNIRNYNSGSTKLKSKLDKYCTIINGKKKSFGTLMDEGKIEVGDVIIGKGHTYVYRGNGTVFASGHDAKWHKDKSVKSDDSNKAVFESWVRKYKGTYDERFKVHYIIRVKDSFVPKYYRDEDGNLVKNR